MKELNNKINIAIVVSDFLLCIFADLTKFPLANIVNIKILYTFWVFLLIDIVRN